MTANDPLLTVYAYYADWRASQVLNIALPPEHWQRLPKLYSEKEAQSLPVLHKALMLWMMKEIGLPVEGIADSLGASLNPQGKPASNPLNPVYSLLLAEADSLEAQAMAQVLLSRVNPSVQVPASSWDLLRKSNAPAVQALLILARQLPMEQAEKLLSGLSAESATMDRALALVWLHQAMGGKALERGVQARLTGAWQAKTSSSGIVQYQWPAATVLPTLLKTEQSGKGLIAQVQFDSSATEAHALPVKLIRKIYRLEKQEAPKTEKTEKAAEKSAEKADGSKAKKKAAVIDATSGGASFSLVLLKPGTPLKTGELYLDEISIEAEKGFQARYAIAEVPLPPGGAVESGTWGIALKVTGKEAEALEKARHQVTSSGYAIPFDAVNGSDIARHLLRFSQPGKYRLPPARFYRMYQPEKKAFEAQGRDWEKVEVQ